MSEALAENMRTEAMRIEEDALLSAKGHFEAARTWGGVHLWIGIPIAILAAITSASAFNQEATVAGCLAIVVAALSAVSTFVNPSERAQSHHQAGAKYNSLRNRSRVFRQVDLISNGSPSDLVALLKSLAQERDDLSLSSPQIPRRAFTRARAGVEAGEAEYAVDRASHIAPGVTGDGGRTHKDLGRLPRCARNGDPGPGE